MRIDYSEPKKSYVASQAKPQARKEPAGLITTLVVIAVVIGFIGGFGTGWFFSQKSAKKSFQAAAEQNSLENSPKQPEMPPDPPQVKPQPAPADSAPQNPQPAPDAVQAVPGSPSHREPALSFYKTLPSGQINNVLGSGINTRDEKVKQPLQAAMPSNIIRQQQPAVNNAKPATEKAPTADKPVAKTTDRGYVVQVASFSLKSEAEALKKTLASKGYNVTVSESNLGDKGMWYRVRVGKRLEQDAAKELAGKLGRGAIVIPDHD
jgi:cell division protein FtsN